MLSSEIFMFMAIHYWLFSNQIIFMIMTHNEHHVCDILVLIVGIESCISISIKNFWTWSCVPFTSDNVFILIYAMMTYIDSLLQLPFPPYMPYVYTYTIFPIHFMKNYLLFERTGILFCSVKFASVVYLI